MVSHDQPEDTWMQNSASGRGVLSDGPRPAQPRGSHRDYTQRGGRREDVWVMVIENVPLRVEEVIEKLHL